MHRCRTAIVGAKETRDYMASDKEKLLIVLGVVGLGLMLVCVLIFGGVSWMFAHGIGRAFSHN